MEHTFTQNDEANIHTLSVFFTAYSHGEYSHRHRESTQLLYRKAPAEVGKGTAPYEATVLSNATVSPDKFFPPSISLTKRQSLVTNCPLKPDFFTHLLIFLASGMLYYLSDIPVLIAFWTTF